MLDNLDNSVFFYENQKQFKDVVFVPLSRRFQKNGKVIDWKFKRIDTNFDNRLIDASYEYNQETNTRIFNEQDYMLRFLVASCVYPELDNTELQESYNVARESDLLLSLLSDPDEYKESYQKVKTALKYALEEEYNREQEEKYREDEVYD